jgi:hypothetical protein
VFIIALFFNGLPVTYRRELNSTVDGICVELFNEPVENKEREAE